METTKDGSPAAEKTNLPTENGLAAAANTNLPTNDGLLASAKELITRTRESFPDLPLTKQDATPDQKTKYLAAAIASNRDHVFDYWNDPTIFNLRYEPDLIYPLYRAIVANNNHAINVIFNHRDIEDLVNNTNGPNGNTALMAAAYHGNTECIQKLMQAGADSAATNDKKQTPLHFAIQSIIDGKIKAEDQLPTINLLLHSIDPNSKDREGISSKDLAKDIPEITRLFQEHESSKNSTPSPETKRRAAPKALKEGATPAKTA